MAEGVIRLGNFDLEAHRQACLRAAEAELDPHKAFHLRSGMSLDFNWLCAECRRAE